MGEWMVPILCALLFCALFWFLLRRTMPVVLVASVGLFALAGYVWTGTPGMPGVSVATTVPPQVEFDPNKASQALQFTDRFSASARWMAMADNFAQRGNFDTAAGLLVSATRQYPKDAEIWVMLGNILEAKAGTPNSPPALLAFRNAARINPDSPSLLYRAAMMQLESGDLPAAIASWERLLAVSPKSAGWRSDVERIVTLAKQRVASQQSGAKALPAPNSVDASAK
jgi:cytochrome c-type biogenesis protein CcmH